MRMFLTPVAAQPLILMAHRYNCLVHDHEQPYISSYHLESLAQLFLRYNVEAVFGLHLVHSHFKIPSDTVMLGSIFSGDPSGYWTKPTPWKHTFTRKHRMHSPKTLLYHTYLLVQVCTALTGPNTADIAHPTEAANGLHVDTPFVRSDADGQLNTRQVRSRLFPPITTKTYDRTSLR